MIEPRFRVDRCEIAGEQGVTENGSYSLAVDYEYILWKCPGVLGRIARGKKLLAWG